MTVQSKLEECINNDPKLKEFFEKNKDLSDEELTSEFGKLLNEVLKTLDTNTAAILILTALELLSDEEKKELLDLVTDKIFNYIQNQASAIKTVTTQEIDIDDIFDAVIKAFREYLDSMLGNMQELISKLINFAIEKRR